MAKSKIFTGKLKKAPVKRAFEKSKDVFIHHPVTGVKFNIVDLSKPRVNKAMRVNEKEVALIQLMRKHGLHNIVENNIREIVAPMTAHIPEWTEAMKEGFMKQYPLMPGEVQGYDKYPSNSEVKDVDFEKTSEPSALDYLIKRLWSLRHNINDNTTRLIKSASKLALADNCLEQLFQKYDEPTSKLSEISNIVTDIETLDAALKNTASHLEKIV